MKNIDIKNSHKTSKNLSSENCLLSIYVKMLIIYIYINDGYYIRKIII